MRQQAIAKSDKVTHGRHMKQGERFGNKRQQQFVKKSHDRAAEMTKEQAANGIMKRISEEEKKKKPDAETIAQLKSGLSVGKILKKVKAKS